MSKRKLPTFRVSGFVRAVVDLEVQADNLEQAVALSRGLKTDDFVQSHGDVGDWSVQIIGVSSDWPEINV